jgi:hypothetical protein
MLIARLLSSVIRLWLKSQISTTDNLNIKIIGKEQQILQGSIPEVFISATNLVYQKLHFSEIELIGSKIKFNLTQILKRQPLQLLEPIVVNLKVIIQEKDLQNSLASALLATGLNDLWTRFLIANNIESTTDKSSYQWERLSLLESGISFTGKHERQNHEPTFIRVISKIELDNAHTLLLSPLEIVTIPELSLKMSNSLIFDLGKQVTLTDCYFTPQYLFLKGTITIYPELNN